MAPLFKIIDKTGRTVHLTNERWEHITSPASLHAYMSAYLEEIKRTLIQPEIISADIHDPMKHNYYRYYKFHKRHLKVIVKYLNGNGYVITAYFVRHVLK